MFSKIRIQFFPKDIIKRFHSDFAKRLFFLKQYEGTVKRIWGLEFTQKGLRVGREDLRREYDKLNETLDAALVAIEKAQGEEKDKLEKLIEIKKQEIEEWKKKIDLADQTLQELADQIDGYYTNLKQVEEEIYNV